MNQKTKAKKIAAVKRNIKNETSAIYNKALLRISVVAIILFIVVAFECYFFTQIIYLPDFEFKALISSTAAIGIVVLFLIEIIANRKIDRLR